MTDPPGPPARSGQRADGRMLWIVLAGTATALVLWAAYEPAPWKTALAIAVVAAAGAVPAALLSAQRRRIVELEAEAQRLAAQSAAEADQRLAASEEKLADCAQRLRQASHDLRTPLQTLMTMSGLLLESKLAPEQREYATFVRKSSESVRTIAEEMSRPVGAPAPAAASAAPASAAPAPARTIPLRVLVVDDDTLSRTSVVRMLEKLGHAAETVGSGEEAVSAVERRAFDAVLCDVRLDGMSGIDATRRIRRINAPGGGAPPRVIGVTGTVQPEDRAACLEAGMEAVLVKPVDADTLRAALAAPPARPAAAAELRVPPPAPASEPSTTGEIAVAPDLDPDILASLRAQNCGPGRTLLDEFVELYTIDTPKLVEQLHTAAVIGDAEELGVVSHKLKGSSAAIGARGVAALAGEIELLARVGDVAAASRVVKDLEDAWPVTREALQELRITRA